MAPANPTHVADLLRRLTVDPGRPRLTWYGDDGERIELSGAVFENWANKSLNLLVEEFDAKGATTVVLDAPAHWRTVVWATAVWRAGATLAPGLAPSPTAPVDVVVTTRPTAWACTRAEVVALALPALARRFDGELPPGALDAAGAVMTYGDQIGYVADLDPAAPALLDGPTHAELVDWAQAATDPHGTALPTTAERVVLEADDLTATLRRALHVLAADGSLVLVSPATAAALRDDPARRARLVTGERATLDLLG
ncbi:uncharacterized protein (TIGR03089 family) [Sediminihabitans luteus]|uniref:Uncharacterized protein (TIGR03089 family) n=1 Tax=Sediminihabitans luteus TaxID=1138585 RepID=A0A2M9CDP2_9CELL|nr:TIGR03089 family protein [Sediminihabitans luteus]PJJ69982.1 uncharacterized protein (TIGR03089 family) [Sediminihabitans luteus]GII99303.1 hypothetical protein Slu03_16810 [Sediminihabitans luteus]